MIDTPRTDKLEVDIRECELEPDDAISQLLNHARHIERQNAALLEVAKAAYPLHYDADPESGCGCSRCAEFHEAYSNLKQAGVDI